MQLIEWPLLGASPVRLLVVPAPYWNVSSNGTRVRGSGISTPAPTCVLSTTGRRTGPGEP